MLLMTKQKKREEKKKKHRKISHSFTGMEKKKMRKILIFSPHSSSRGSFCVFGFKAQRVSWE
jgi:hypothetical protein